MRIKHTALVAGLFIATTMGMTSSVLADESSSAFTTAGNITFTSNYYYRGVSQTSNLSAVQGSLTVNHSSGLYASVWSSNVNNVISAGGQELDPSIGFTSSVGDVAYDVGVLQYGYPGDRTKSFREAYGSVSYKGAKLVWLTATTSTREMVNRCTATSTTPAKLAAATLVTAPMPV